MDFLTIPCVDSDGTWRRGALTARLKFTLADGDSDGIPDWWENLYAGAGLSPTNSADVWLNALPRVEVNFFDFSNSSERLRNWR